MPVLSDLQALSWAVQPSLPGLASLHLQQWEHTHTLPAPYHPDKCCSPCLSPMLYSGQPPLFHGLSILDKRVSQILLSPLNPPCLEGHWIIVTCASAGFFHPTPASCKTFKSRDQTLPIVISPEPGRNMNTVGTQC